MNRHEALTELRSLSGDQTDEQTPIPKLARAAFQRAGMMRDEGMSMRVEAVLEVLTAEPGVETFQHVESEEPRQVKLLPAVELMADGYLHEANRQFFHPLGLALAVAIEPKTHAARIQGVWDGREDPEGFVMGADLLSPEKARKVSEAWEARRRPREESLGYMVQPTNEPAGGDQ